MRALYYSTLLLLLGVGTLAQGQMVYDWETRAENFHYRVKNIEFFMDRFNSQPEGSGSAKAANPKDTAACIAFMQERDNKLFSLFDLGKIDRKDAALKEKINTFFRQINSPYNPMFIRFEDPAWCALVEFKVTAKGKPERLQCVMQVVPLGRGAVGWAIKSFQSEPLGIEERFYPNILSFPPSVNGTDFMNVRLALNNTDWTKGKMSKLDMPYSLALQQLSDGKIKIDAISRITYHFLQLDGWIMTVNYVQRESKNSGWLIDSLSPASAQDKTKYKKELLIE